MCDIASKKLDLVFLLHTSYKMTHQKFQYFKGFILNMLRDADIDSGNVRVAVAMYRLRGKVIFDLNAYSKRNDLLKAVHNLRTLKSRQGNVAFGLRIVRKEILTPEAGDRPNAPNVVILLTDAESTMIRHRIEAQANLLRNQTGSRVFAVGVGRPEESDGLKNEMKLVTGDKKDVFYLNYLDGLMNTRNAIANQVFPCKPILKCL